MHERRTIDAALVLADGGLGATAIGRHLGVPRSTVRDWLVWRRPRSPHGADGACGLEHEFATLSADYVYLLGLWLGDGCLSISPKRVPKLRIALDAKYPGIIAEAREAIQCVRGVPGGALVRRGYVEVYSYWRHWPCFIPQHGPGKKHERAIVLEPWQEALVRRWPRPLLHGLVQSDGCRFQNTGTGWSAPRYSFKQISADIRDIFCTACERIGVHFTLASDTVYVSRKADVALLDQFVGPKA